MARLQDRTRRDSGDTHVPTEVTPEKLLRPAGIPRRTAHLASPARDLRQVYAQSLTSLLPCCQLISAGRCERVRSFNSNRADVNYLLNCEPSEPASSDAR